QNGGVLGEVAVDADAARFLAADQNLPGWIHHQVADELESDPALDQLASMFGGDAVLHARGVEGAHHVARPVLASDQPLQEDGIDLVGVDKAAVLRRGPDAVRIAIGDEAGMALFLNYHFLQSADVRLNRLRINSRKQRVHLAPDLHMGDASPLENVGEDVAPRAVHAVDGKLEAGLGDLLQVGKSGDGMNVSRLEVGFLDLRPYSPWHGAGTNVVLNLGDDGRRGRSAVRR